MAKYIDNYNDLKELGIDCDQTNDSLTEIFNRAASHLQSLLPNIDSQMLLILYGYYKQGSEGICNVPKPSWFDMRAKSKWEAWNKLGNMPQVEARRLYVESIKKLDPGFDDSEDKHLPKEQWVKVSSMLDDTFIADCDKTMVDHIKEGNIEEVKKYLNSSNIIATINESDADGLAPIHWAADSGFLEIVKILINSGAEVNLQDADGQTALHYASSCGHVECVKYLLEQGGQTDSIDNEGCTPLSVASDDSVKELLSNGL
ncbi:hypothetical protein NQ314_008029 [Rhamnusium bicolor]|uniref:Acyl-CoA-binding domain-containing protein 6 n=1 Tax=Rhamnusium bicolor TaxID=1586634 RepID=A0AAV8YFI6_9CUCU|nr:hypothetical protein NQ314_008029 [Rhamnusium bicolor]